jgi:hypothetical protein
LAVRKTLLEIPIPRLVGIAAREKRFAFVAIIAVSVLQTFF